MPQNGLRPTYDSIADMPPALSAYLLSDEFGKQNTELQKQFGLTEDQTDTIGDLLQDAISNDISLLEALQQMKAEIVPTPVPAEKWTECVSEIIRRQLWPLRELFGNELKEIMDGGGISPAGWPQRRVLLKPLTYSGAASEIAASVGISISGGQSRERLRDLVMTKSKGVRIDSQVKEVLVRQADFGGLGLDSPTADKVIAAMNELLGSVSIMSEEEYADWLASETSRKSSVERRASPDTDDDKEIEAIKAKMPVMAAVPSTILEQAVEETFTKLENRPTDEYLTKRLRNVISSRLRDVRSEFEVRQLLQRDSKVGGLGFTAAVGEKMSSQIEEGYRTFHDRIMEEEKGRLNTQLDEQKLKIEERRKREAEEHAKWYQERVAARKLEEEGRSKMTEQMKNFVPSPAPVPSHPIDKKEKKTETERFGELVPAIPPPEPKAPTPSTPTPFGNMSPPSTPPPAKRPEIKVSRATIDLQQATPMQKPRLDDVKVAPTRYMGLTSPVEELKALNLSEFRRLAKEPEAAAQKVMQKIETIGQESFDRRIEAVEAWQQSGLQRSYMDLVTAAFGSGKPIMQLAEEKRANGEDVPSPAELSAIISLNSRLHF